MSPTTRAIAANGHKEPDPPVSAAVTEYNNQLVLAAASYDPEFHGDNLIADKQIVATSLWYDLSKVFGYQNASKIATIIWKGLTGKGLDMVAGSQIVASLPENGPARNLFIVSKVTDLYNRMLHPPLTYLGDAFQYRSADGKFNNVLYPHLGQGGAPYAKTVPSKTHLLGAQPDPGDIFDRLMARQPNGRQSLKSGLSSMLIYHATIIIHDIFRTNDTDKNISDSSSYLDLSPLYGYTEQMQRKVRDGKYKLGLLRPDTFAEDRLLRQPPGVCIMLVMYNRYHNYAATQLRRINENGRFSLPRKYALAKPVAIVNQCMPASEQSKDFNKYMTRYHNQWQTYRENGTQVDPDYTEEELQERIDKATSSDPKLKEKVDKFAAEYDAAQDKLDDDLFNTARLITCGMYVNISIHDYLRALMGFHQYDTTFTLEPRVAINEGSKKDAVSRGIGNQVTVEFNLLYRFHCAISLKDEGYTEELIKEEYGKYVLDDDGKAVDLTSWDPKTMTLNQFLGAVGRKKFVEKDNPVIEPYDVEFGIKRNGKHDFSRNETTRLFDDQLLMDELMRSMDDPISNFGPLNVPRSLRSVEILGILQSRKWNLCTLNDFREFFGMARHKTFEDITKNDEVQNALRDLYDHPDKVELYPGVFCEGDKANDLDPGPREGTSALWAAIFSDAITLVRSDRFYTVDWNTDSLTSWGMKEVTPDSDVLKGSIFHRLIQRAFPEWLPYDSIRFFHPFYTAAKNTELASAQGYIKDFRKASATKSTKVVKLADMDLTPRKPLKPVYLSQYEDVKAVFTDKSGSFVHPICVDANSLPKKLQELLTSTRAKSGFSEKLNTKENEMILQYFETVTREIVEREIIVYNKVKPTYQIDITRDLAIPVVTRFVADFLGFSDRLKSEANPKGEFSENEIYQHITNCQVFLAYNVDETKMWKRRMVFKESMEFLYGLAQSGNIKEANRFALTRTILGLFRRRDTSAAKHMKDFGMKVAQDILKTAKDSETAAAILLLTALDGAYNSVLAFSSVLNYLFNGLVQDQADSDWIKIQENALKDDTDGDKFIAASVLEAQRLSVRLPVIRKVASEVKLTIGGISRTYKKGDTIILDVYSASQNKPAGQGYLTYTTSLSEGLVSFNARDIASVGLTAMIKVLAQMKNLRRGHDTQGQLKIIKIDQAYEGYANFMAPGRMEEIRRVTKSTPEEERGKDGLAKKPDYILEPVSETYLTPEWDEMVPFPSTWKLRFDGYGVSDYSKIPLDQNLVPIELLYTSQGPSHYGGTFADTACICNEVGKECKCKGVKATVSVPNKSIVVAHAGAQLGGCGMP